MSKRPKVEHDFQLSLLLREYERRLAAQNHRQSNAESRAGGLIAACAVFAGLLATTAMTYDLLLAFVVNIAATGFGIAALFPRAVEEIAPSRARDKILGGSPEEGSLYLADRYKELVEKREKSISIRMSLVRAGLVLLGVSLIFAANAFAQHLEGR